MSAIYFMAQKERNKEPSRNMLLLVLAKLPLKSATKTPNCRLVANEMKEEMGPGQDPQQMQIHSNKRKLAHNADLYNSAYFKIRSLARELRPHFIQVLQTHDFRNSKAANEIKLQMKVMVNLYKQMIAEIQQEEEQSDLLQPKQSLDESTEKKPQTPPFSSNKKLNEIGQARESYIVGGSAIGWNFITFSGSKPVYYGASKKSFRNTEKKKYK